MSETGRNEERAKVDWVHPPVGMPPRSLWAALHDATLVSVRSDRLARTAQLTLHLAHVCRHEGLSADVRFLLQLDGVSSVRATTFSQWPGPCDELRGLPIPEQGLRVKAYWAKGREESLGWEELERLLERGELDVSEASLVEGQGQLALQVGGNLSEGDAWVELHLRAERLSVARSDGATASLDSLLASGEAYWDRFGEASGAKARTRHDAAMSEAEPILDAEVIARLHELEQGDERLVAELMAEFLTRTPERFERMRELFASQDLGELEREAHSFNGSCGALGITRMRVRARELEQHLKERGLAGAEALFARLEGAFTEALPLLSAEL